jgi:iron(II)-dependent oxidoreductase
VTPSRILTWFQSAAAARNAGKRLPTNAEWQAAALGTPDGAPCIVGGVGPGPTGTAGCVSNVGAFDMVGNLWEWVADWVPLSTACVVPGLFGMGDLNCLAGASTTSGPGALVRGGSYWTLGTGAGVFAILGFGGPSFADHDFGFRCAR